MACAVVVSQASSVFADDLIVLNTPGEVPKAEFDYTSNTFSLFNQSASDNVFTLLPATNSNEQNEQNALTVSKAAIALMMTATSSPTVIDYTKLTSAMVESFSKDDEVIPCAVDILLDETNSCSEIERAQEVLQLHKSIQALARALELSGSGIPTRVHEDIIKQDIIENGLDAGLITPAARLARIYAVDVDFFAENRGQDIYELSNLALGYIFTPDFSIQNDNGFWSYNNRDHYEAWVDTGEGCEALKIQIENQIPLLEYSHSSLPDAASDYAILDNFGSEVRFFDNNNQFSLFTVGSGYQLRRSTSPYDVNAMGNPSLSTLLYIDSKASMVVQRLGPERWGRNTFDPLQSFLDNNVPYQYFSGGSQVCVNRCVGSPANQRAIDISKMGAMSSIKDFGDALKTQNPIYIVATGLIAIDSIATSIHVENSVNNNCTLACMGVQIEQDELDFLNRQNQLSNASLYSVEQKLHELRDNVERREQLAGEIEAANGTVGSLRDKIPQEYDNSNIPYDELIELEDQLRDARQKEIDLLQEQQRLIEAAPGAEGDIPDLQEEQIEIRQKILEQQNLIREAEQKLQQAQEALEVASGNAPRVLADNCSDPNFVKPTFTTCTFDGANFVLVPDQMAIDMAVYEARCTNITVPIGYACTVVNGEAVITGMQINVDSNFAPARNHCHYMYVAEGYTCTMVDGQPVIKSSYGSIVDNRSFEVPLSPCNYTTPAEGFICVDGPTGPTMVNEVDPQQIQRLISRTQSRSCSQNDRIGAPLVDTFNSPQINWLENIDFDQEAARLPTVPSLDLRLVDFN